MISIIILAGLLLRILFPFQRYFDFDQEQIAVAAQSILNGHLTLIGPLAGTIRFFTGPLIYYVAAFWYWITGGHPWAGTLVISSIFIFSAVVLWLSLRRITSRLIALIFVGIYSLSAHVVTLERIAWDPNFSFLAGSLVLIGLLFPAGKLSYLLGFLGMWLSYQAHFSGFVLAVSVIILGAGLRRWRFLIFSLAGLVFSLLPTIIFDFRHFFLNSQGLLALLTNPQKVSGGFSVFNRFGHLLLVTLENQTKIITPTFPQWSLIGLGGLILTYWFLKKKSIFKPIQRKILIIWILVFPAVMMFYRGSIPEYYFLMQLPATVFILTDLILSQIRHKLVRFTVLSGFFLIALGVVIREGQMLSAGPSLDNKLQALSFIKKNLDNKPAKLVLDMEVKDRFGWKYLVDYLRLPMAEEGAVVHLIYPIKPGAILTAKFGGIGVWFDRRGEVDAEAFVDDINGVLFYYPKNYWRLGEFERILFPGNTELRICNLTSQNKIGVEAIKSGILYIYLPKDSAFKYFEAHLQDQKPPNLDRWQSVAFLEKNLSGRKTLSRERKDTLFIFSFPQNYTWKDIELFLNRVEGF